MNLQQELMTIVSVLESAGIPYAVCRGLAVALHGYPRATQDIDIMIREQDLESVKILVKPIGYFIPGGIIPFKIGTAEERRVFRISRILDGELLTLDLMLVAPIFHDVWANRIRLRLNSREISVVSRKGLARMKRLAARYKDLADLEGLGMPLEDDHDA